MTLFNQSIEQYVYHMIFRVQHRLSAITNVFHVFHVFHVFFNFKQHLLKVLFAITSKHRKWLFVTKKTSDFIIFQNMSICVLKIRLAKPTLYAANSL